MHQVITYIPAASFDTLYLSRPKRSNTFSSTKEGRCELRATKRKQEPNTTAAVAPRLTQNLSFNSSFKIEPNRVILGIHGGFQGVGVKRPLFIDMFNSLVSDCRQSLLPVAGMKFRSSREFLNECG